MPKKVKEISVFFPAYNEEANIANTVVKAKNVLEKIADKWEIIIVNDGSSDDTLKIAKELVKEDERVRVVNHKVNRGYGAAFKTGFYSGKYSWTAFTDSDGQFDFAEITKFIEKQRSTKADMVIGYYLDRKVSLIRKLNTFVWKVIVFLLFGLKVRDVDTGFKLFSKKVINKLPTLESERGAFIESELLIKAIKMDFKIEEVGVRHFPRKEGSATGANIDVVINSFKDLFKLWKKLR